MFSFSHNREENRPPESGRPGEKVRRHILFYGRVQGVGFRYYSVMKARQLDLTGWVRNLVDGSVSMEVQGDPRSIEELIAYLKHQRYIRIDRMDVRELPVNEGERRFREAGEY